MKTIEKIYNVISFALFGGKNLGINLSFGI